MTNLILKSQSFHKKQQPEDSIDDNTYNDIKHILNSCEYDSIVDDDKETCNESLFMVIEEDMKVKRVFSCEEFYEKREIFKISSMFNSDWKENLCLMKRNTLGRITSMSSQTKPKSSLLLLEKLILDSI